MYFSENLVSHLMARRKKPARPFHIGGWLDTLDDKDVERLRSLSELAVLRAGNEATDDLVMVVVTAFAAESRVSRRIDPEQMVTLIQHFAIVAHIEHFRRNGWLEVLEPLSVLPEADLTIQVTQKGFDAAEQMRVGGQKLFH